MIIDNETITRLSHLRLQEYDRNLEAVLGKDRRTYGDLMYSPVRITLNGQSDVCESDLYEIVASF